MSGESIPMKTTAIKLAEQARRRREVLVDRAKRNRDTAEVCLQTARACEEEVKELNAIISRHLITDEGGESVIPATTPIIPERQPSTEQTTRAAEMQRQLEVDGKTDAWEVYYDERGEPSYRPRLQG
jgi:hypothetical protein